MLIRNGKRGWLYNGIKIDMYQLAQWLYVYNRQNNCYFTPSTVTNNLVEQYMIDTKNQTVDLTFGRL